MGMASSQVRFMGLTHRLHDVEYRAQNILGQKMMLATQKDDLYQKYNNALDATKIQVAFMNGDGSRNYIDATFDTLCNYDPARAMEYSLKDAVSGKVIVDPKTAKTYEDFNTDKYAFAYAMLGMGNDFGWPVDSDTGRLSMGSEIGVGVSNEDYGYGQDENGNYNLFMTDVERKVFDAHAADNDGKLQKQFDKLNEICNDSESTQSDKEKALENFRDSLYKEAGCSAEIYKYMLLNKNDSNNTELVPQAVYNDDLFPSDLPKGQFQYYLNLFDQIKQSGGCIEVDPRFKRGDEGNEWLNNMVGSGKVLIDVHTDKGWIATSVATSSNENFLQEVQDKTDLKKAEAEYEHALDLINRKDTRYDQELNKLETERSALKTELDSIKKVKDDNIERTFNIFS